MAAASNDLNKLDIRVGQVIKAEFFDKAKKPAYRLWIDFGNLIGVKKSSARLCDCYGKDELIGRQILGVVNLSPRQIGDFMSEVLGTNSAQGVVLIQPSGRWKTATDWLSDQ